MGKKVYIKTDENNLEQVILESNLIDSENNLREEFVTKIDQSAEELYDDIEQKFLKNIDLSDVLKIVDNEGNVGLKLDSNGLHALDFIAGIHKLSEKANNTDLINHINNVQTHLRVSDIINLINKYSVNSEQIQYKEGNNIDISDDNTIGVKGYIFDDILESFSEGYRGLNFIDTGEDAEILTDSVGTPTNRFKTNLNLDITINNLIKIDKTYYHITNKETTDEISFIYTVDESIIYSAGRIYFINGACGFRSHTEGFSTKAVGDFSHAEGSASIGIGYASHAEGLKTSSFGKSSHSEGNGVEAVGEASHAEGFYTKTNNLGEHAQGKFNLSNYVPDDSDPAYRTISSIGIGTNENDRKNAFEVMENGDVYIYGLGNYDGTNQIKTSTLQECLNDNFYEIGEMSETDCYAWYSKQDGYSDITMKCFWQTHGNYVIVSLKNVKVITGWQDIYYSLPKQVYDGFDVSGVFVSYTSNEIIGWSTMIHEGVNVIRFRKTSGNFTTNNPGINITFQYRYK